MTIASVLLLVTSALVSTVSAATYNLYNTTANWQATLSTLKAGDIAILHYGIYTKTSQYMALTLNGTLTNPIIIQGATGEQRPILQGSVTGASAQNVLNVQGSNFMIKGIAFTGGSRGVRVGTAPTSNAIFDNILIFNTTGTAFSCNDAGVEYVNITLRNSEITNTNAYSATTGECVYLGCGGDACRIRDSLLEHNYCHDTLGSSGGSRAGFQVKTGSHRVVIRNNVCYNVVGPCIVVYDDYDRGRNLIDGNVAINAGTADLGIQATSGATITNNIVVNAKLAGIGIIVNDLYAKAAGVRNITISRNTIYMSTGDACLRLNTVTNRNIIIVNNVIFCGASQCAIKASNSLAGALVLNNAINGSLCTAGGLATCATFTITDKAFISASGKNFYPAASSPLINAGINVPYQAIYDFNGTPRSAGTPSVGAYEYFSPTNPGAAIGAMFKGGSATATVPQYQLIA